MQEESSKEINRLKQEITVLKLKVEPKAASKENNTSMPSAGRPGILKRRRYWSFRDVWVSVTFRPFFSLLPLSLFAAYSIIVCLFFNSSFL